jgi:NTE family protein
MAGRSGDEGGAAASWSAATDLVLEGGGVKGSALVGAIAAFEEAGFRLHRFAGTSVGSMVAALLAAGYSAARLREVMLQIDYAGLLDATRAHTLHLGRLGAAMAEILDEGLYRGDSLHELVSGLLADAGVRTFADLRLDDPGLDPNTPPDRRFRVVVVASDITRQLMVRIPWDLRRVYGLDPETFPVADAVRMSTAIPFFYVPVSLRSELTGQVSHMVDGGLTSSFPLHIFDRTDGRPPRWPTVHIGLVTAPRADQPVHELGSRTDFLRAVVHTALHGRINAERTETEIAHRTITIDTSYVSSTDFSIGREMRLRLFDDGYAAARSFLERWDLAAYRSAATGSPQPPEISAPAVSC